MMELLIATVYLSAIASLAIPLASGWKPLSGRVWLLSAALQAIPLAAVAVIAYASTGEDGYLLYTSGAYPFLALSASVGCLLSTLAIGSSAYRWSTHPGVYSLAPLVLLGLIHLSMSTSPLVVLAAWLLVAVAGYILVALPGDEGSLRASLVYGVVGMSSTLLLVLGIALSTVAERGAGGGLLPVAAAGLIVASLGFKLGLFPFHWWVPEVYGRADGRSVSILAGSYKPAFAAALLYLLSETLPESSATAAASRMLLLVGLASITYGNIAALVARDLQDILAYSSIANSGFMAVALALAISGGAHSSLALLGLLALALATASAKPPLFALAPAVGRDVGHLGRLQPDGVSRASVAVLALNLLGVPPLLGFWGKVLTALALLYESPLAAVVYFVNIAVSSVYYLRIVLSTLRRDETVERLEAPLRASLALSAALSLAGVVLVFAYALLMF